MNTLLLFVALVLIAAVALALRPACPECSGRRWRIVPEGGKVRWTCRRCGHTFQTEDDAW